MFKRIVATLVANPEGSRAVERAIEMAAESNASLHLVAIAKPQGVTQAFASISGPDVARTVEGDREHSLDQPEEQAVARAKRQGIPTTTQLVDGDIVDSVLNILQQQGADLLILGLHRDGSALGRLWSKVGELAGQTPCCILGVP